MTIPGGLIALFAAGRLTEGTHSFDAVSAATFVGTDPATFTHTCAADATVLVVTIGVLADPRGETEIPTYNGIALTRAFPTQDFSETVSELWYLLDPPTGSAYTISIPNTNTLSLRANAMSFISSTGKSEFDVAAGSTGTTTSISESVTTTKDGCALIQIVGSGNQTALTNESDILIEHLDLGGIAASVQYALQELAGSKTMSMTSSSSEDFTTIIAAFKPA